MSKDFTNIKKVIEVHGTHSINKLIEAGWIVMAVAEGKDEYGAPVVKYSLGHIDPNAPTSFY